MDRRVPTEPPTYRESLDATYELMREAAKSEATALERLDRAWRAAEQAGLVRVPVGDREYTAAYFQPMRNPAPHQIAASKEVGSADAAFQKARAERKHWERYWRRYADMLDANPELGDQQLRRVGWVRKVAARAA